MVEEFERPCCWFNSEAYCKRGFLFNPHTHEPVRIEEDDIGGLTCPNCNGLGYILTVEGKRLIEMLSRHMIGKNDNCSSD